MNENILEDFIKIGTESQEDAELIFKMTTQYLDELKAKKYEPEFATYLEGFVDKMIAIGENFNIGENLKQDLLNETNNLVVTINSIPKNLTATVQFFNKVYSNSMKFYSSVLKVSPKSNINFGAFKPDNSNKAAISSIIFQAIELIRNSSVLQEKVKKDLIDKLNFVITELDNPKTNWNIYFRQTSYVMTFLGTMASIIGGIEASKNLLESKAKLEEANVVLEQTSKTLSQKDLIEVLIIDENQQLNPNVTLQIEEKSTTADKKKK